MAQATNRGGNNPKPATATPSVGKTDETTLVEQNAAPTTTADAPVTRDVRIVFTKPYTSDGSGVKSLRDGDVVANASIVNGLMPAIGIHGIGIKLMKSDKSIAITWPNTANGMMPVIGGIMVRLDVPQYDLRGREQQYGMKPESAAALSALAQLVRDAWVAANKLPGGPFGPAGASGVPVALE